MSLLLLFHGQASIAGPMAGSVIGFQFTTAGSVVQGAITGTSGMVFSSTTSQLKGTAGAVGSAAMVFSLTGGQPSPIVAVTAAMVFGVGTANLSGGPSGDFGSIRTRRRGPASVKTRKVQH